MMMALGGEAAQHYWLTQGMARAVGVNLSRAISDGNLTRDHLRVMVVRCRMCGRADKCMDWLGRSGGGADHLPRYCANKRDLESLAGIAQTATGGGRDGGA